MHNLFTDNPKKDTAIPKKAHCQRRPILVTAKEKLLKFKNLWNVLNEFVSKNWGQFLFNWAIYNIGFSALEQDIHKRTFAWRSWPLPTLQKTIEKFRKWSMTS